MNIDEMKNRISMALKDPILQQGFECICKDLAELEKENALLKGRNEGFELQIMGLLIKYEEVYKRFPDLKSAMDKAKAILKENAELKKEWQEQVQKATDEGYARTLQTIQLSKAKEIIKRYLTIGVGGKITRNYLNVTKEAEQFLKDDGCPDCFCEDCTKDCDIDNAIQQANKGLDFDKIADEMEQDLKDSEVEK